MAGPYDFTGQNIENTYQRVVQTPDGINFYDGTGSAITFTATATAGGNNTQIQFNSASLLSGSSNFSFDFTNNNVLLTGSLLMSGSSYISGVDYIDFDTTASNAGAVGRLLWNDNDGTLDLGLKGGNVTLQIGQEEVIRVVNKSGTNLTEAGYPVVRITGAQGGRIKVGLAKGDGDANSLDTLGLVTEDIANNQEGYVTVSGLVRKINTTGNLQGETWNEGDALYLSPTVFGGITKIPPTAPSHSVRLGYVVQASSNGSIFVKVDNGYEIDELHNVNINTGSLSHGDLLIYDSSVWYNSKQLSGSYGLTGSLSFNNGGITGSLFGTASRAISASWAYDAYQAQAALFAQNAAYSTNAGTAATADSATTADYADNSGIAGFAYSSSQVLINNEIKSGLENIRPFLLPDSRSIDDQGYYSNLVESPLEYNARRNTISFRTGSIGQRAQLEIGQSGSNQSGRLIVYGEVWSSGSVILQNSIKFVDVLNTASFNSLTNLSFRNNSLVLSTGSFSGSFSGSLFGTASWATNSLTASYITASNIQGPFGSNSVLSASYALTASYALSSPGGGGVSENLAIAYAIALG